MIKLCLFLNKIILLVKKALDFKNWCKIGEIIRSGDHLTPKGFQIIKEIRSEMNTGRLKKATL